MAKTRALITQTERDRIARIEDVEDIKRYQAISRVRRRVEDELTEDVAVLEEHHPGLLEEVREVVCEDEESERTAESDSSEDVFDPVVEGDQPDTEAKEDVYGELQTYALTEEQRKEIAKNLTGSGDTLEARVDAIEKMYRELQRRGEATSDDLVAVIDPEEVRFTGGKKTTPEESSWSNLVKGKNTLSELPGVEKPPVGNETWRYTGESDD